MRRNVVLVATMAFGSILCASAPQAMAGAEDTGELASCEIARSQGIAINGTGAVATGIVTAGLDRGAEAILLFDQMEALPA